MASKKKFQKGNMVDGGYAWVVLATTTVAFSVAGMLLYCSGMFHIVLLEQFNEGHVLTAWAGGLFACNFVMTAPVSSWMINKFSCRVTMMTSGILFAASFLLTAFAPNVTVCIFSLGILGGVAGTMTCVPGWVSLGYYFRRKLTIASGIAGMGFGLGVFALAPAMQIAIDHYSYSNFFILMAGVGLQFVVFGALLTPSKAEINRKIITRNKDIQIAELKQLSKLQSGIQSVAKSVLKLVRHKGLLLLSVSQLTHGFGLLTVYYFLPSYCKSMGTSAMKTAMVLSLLGVGSFFGRGLLGLAASSNDIDALTAYFSLLGCAELITTFFPIMVHSFSGQVIFSTVFGTFTGSINSVFSPLLINIVGLNEHSYAIGCTFCFNGIGSLLGTYTAASIADHGGGFKMAFIISGIANLLTAFCGMAIPVVSTYNQRMEEEKEKHELTIVESESLMVSKQQNDKCQI